MFLESEAAAKEALEEAKNIDEQIAKISEEMESDTRKIEDIEAKIEKAEKIRRLLSCDQQQFHEIHSRSQLY